jgi:glycosyltransferase-like protein LARGE
MWARCDEHFVGYGKNKIACVFALYLSGLELWVLPQDFMIHQDHPYPDSEKTFDVSLAGICPY